MWMSGLRTRVRRLVRSYLTCCVGGLLLSPWTFSTVFLAPACFRTDTFMAYYGVERWPAIKCLSIMAAWAPFYVVVGAPIDVYDEQGPPWYAFGAVPIALTTLATGTLIFAAKSGIKAVRARVAGRRTGT